MVFLSRLNRNVEGDGYQVANQRVNASPSAWCMDECMQWLTKDNFKLQKDESFGHVVDYN